MSATAVSPERPDARARRGEVIVEFKEVWKSYSGRDILAGVNLQIQRGEVLCVLGPSGTGKSVTLRHINGLTRPDSGDVKVFGESIVALTEEQLSPVRRRLAMLFQGGALFDSMNVEDNIAFPVREHTDKTPEEVAAIVAQTLSMVGLPGIQRKMPSELSGGMRKRVALARSISLEPEIILYDEPTTGLDPVSSEKIAQLIVDVNHRLQTTSVVVTHDIVTARTVSTRVVFLHQGRFQFVGTFDEATTNGHPVLRDYFRAMGFPCGTGVFQAVPKGV
ncbi:MAG TPA: ABC transporter ATP-binding protein [Thermoanaerobaculia bacterium]|nr:ABC transporter ATP-binding protein [Thermoanaerobaculia bacterium]